MTAQTKTAAPTASSAPETCAAAAVPGLTRAAATGPAASALGASDSRASGFASASTSRPVVPGPERCVFLRALGAIRDGAVSLVATTALVLGAAWLLRRA